MCQKKLVGRDERWNLSKNKNTQKYLNTQKCLCAHICIAKEPYITWFDLNYRDMSCNNLREVSSGKYSSGRWLQQLFLQKNKITIIYSDAFHGMDYLSNM